MACFLQGVQCGVSVPCVTISVPRVTMVIMGLSMCNNIYILCFVIVFLLLFSFFEGFVVVNGLKGFGIKLRGYHGNRLGQINYKHGPIMVELGILFIYIWIRNITNFGSQWQRIKISGYDKLIIGKESVIETWWRLVTWPNIYYCREMITCKPLS